MEHFYLDLSFHYAADILGFSACGATLATFAQTRMWPMRIFAIAANILFIGYGALGLLYPVLFLHLVLLPLNVARLIQLAAAQGGQASDLEPQRLSLRLMHLGRGRWLLRSVEDRGRRVKAA